MVSFTDAFAPDLAQAEVWLQKAADQGHPGAKQLLDLLRSEVKGGH